MKIESLKYAAKSGDFAELKVIVKKNTK